jgi:ubiquinone/menaquinone biosynthesis C-methylase UbiE
MENNGSTSFPRERLARLAEIERRHFWFAGRRALVSRLLTRHAHGERARVLDLGCGTGTNAEELSRLGFDVVGLDQRPEGLVASRRKRPSSAFAQGVGERLPFSKESFDGVILLDVLEHVDDTEVLAEVARVLKPTGWALLTVPALPWLFSYRDQAAGHRRRYTRRTLRAALLAARLQVRETRYYQFLLFPLVAASRLLGRDGPAWRDREETLHPVVNRLFGAISGLEVRLGDVVPWPVGSSLAVVCRKDAP